MRLQKFMAEAGVASRRRCEEMILEGRVSVNGASAVLGAQVDPKDEVLLDGQRLKLVSERVVIALNKPRGVFCTASDPEGRRTVMDYFKDIPYRLYHVGRLDCDSEGLLFMTNDGELAYKLMHPKFQIEKTYYAVADGVLTNDEAHALENGVLLEDGMTAPAKMKPAARRYEGGTAFFLTIHEGRNRQVRRMLAAVGHRTLLLRRVRVGNVELGGLKTGQWRYLGPEEIEALENILNGAD
ncbi:MAG TPA: pseudouridine synthase [Clostridia bacterium]|nr:pseudouridine synthase [Clostridia bacterium]